MSLDGWIHPFTIFLMFCPRLLPKHDGATFQAFAGLEHLGNETRQSFSGGLAEALHQATDHSKVIGGRFGRVHFAYGVEDVARASQMFG